jgi:hypothetical protein
VTNFEKKHFTKTEEKKELAKLFSRMGVSFYIPTSHVHMVHFSAAFPTSCVTTIFGFGGYDSSLWF